MTSIVSQKLCPFNADFIERTGKNHLDPGQETTREAPVFQHCYLLRNASPKPTGVVEHCREGETNCWFSVFRDVSF
jgi:hypothetical protein